MSSEEANSGPVKVIMKGLSYDINTVGTQLASLSSGALYLESSPCTATVPRH